ncbi:hypothetical protein HHK36_004700 [Tetracentron sinense]|uniref:Aminotransferase-like plant mobile domain-containing protein n=1 Tax=Tetracentron sinense TaxID=13715 RepID=A0A834ZU59_TETSI|nr:hypothetical protein HHK36_004700 [Tetracentron sinense]
MDKFSISQIPKRKIVRTCQGARVAITSSEEYPFFSKDESKEQPVLLIREGEHEEECNATRCHYHTAVIGCCAKDWVLDNENPYFLRNWTKMEKHDMIISGYHDPIRKSLKKVLMLQSSHHEQIHSSGVLPTLGHRITNQETNWRGDFPLQGKMFFIPGYWEWAELMLTRNKDILEKSGVYDAILASLFLYNHNADLIRSFCEAWCPITNSLHTPQGEMSLSLWDLKIIGGLPITGEFYDEVVPSLREITGLDEKLTPVLPFSCRFLFLAYHWVRQSNLSSGDTSHHSVSLSSWITWWFRGDLRYHISNSKQTSFKNAKARQQYPSGKFPYRCRTSKEDSVLHDLGVSSRDEDEVLLAAFLSTWLCMFVMPNNHRSCIRPATFKVASLMAQGLKFSLAIPVLASIYNGLNIIATHKDGPDLCHVTFPWHYIFAWLGLYFNTYSLSKTAPMKPYMCSIGGPARKRFYTASSSRETLRNCKNVIWYSTRPKYIDSVIFREEPNRLMSEYDFEYLISIRSCYLTLRREKHYIVEPYSPHRFARQFGYCQDLPGRLKEDIRETTLKNLVYLWKCSVFRGSSSEFTMPQWKGTDKDIFVSDAFHNWWASNTSEYFKYSLGVLNCMNKMDVVLTAPSRPQSEPALVIIPAMEGSNSTGHGIDDNTSDTHSQNYIANDIKGTRISGSDPLGSSDIVVKTLLSVLSSGSKRSSSEAAEETKVVKNGVGNHSDLDSDRCNFRRQKKNNNDPPVKKKRTSRKKGKSTKVALSVVSSRERLPEIRQSSIIPATDPKFTDDLLDEPVLVDIVQSASETSIGDEGQIRRGARQLLERRISAEKVVVAPMPIPLKVDMRHVSTTQLDIGTSEVAPSLPHYHSSIIAQADERSKRGFPTKEITATPSFSIYQKGRIASDVFATAVKSMGHALLTKLKAAPFDRVLRVQDDALDVYSSITHLKGDSAPLKELVDSYAEDVKAYLQQEASLLNGIPLSEWAKLKASTAEKIDVTSSYLALAQQHLTDCSGELEIVMAKRVSLENELRIVQEKESCLRRDVATKEIDVQVAELEVKSAQKACEDMESVVPVSTAEAENLQDLRKMVEDRRNSIKPSDWMDEIL